MYCLCVICTLFQISSFEYNVVLYGVQNICLDRSNAWSMCCVHVFVVYICFKQNRWMHPTLKRNSHSLTPRINCVNQSNQFHQIALKLILMHTHTFAFILAKFNHVVLKPHALINIQYGMSMLYSSSSYTHLGGNFFLLVENSILWYLNFRKNFIQIFRILNRIMSCISWAHTISQYVLYYNYSVDYSI